MLLLAGLATPALAAQRWRIDSLSDTTVAPGGDLTYHVQATNTGDADMDGSEIDVRATLPAGLTGVSATVQAPDSGLGILPCTAGDGSSPVAGATSVLCAVRYAVREAPHDGGIDYVTVVLTARAAPIVSGMLTTTFQVSGGGAPSASTPDWTRVSDTPPSFGVESFDGQVNADAAGDPLTQAGGHPYDASVSIDFNTITNPQPMIGDVWPVEPTKDVFVDLPPGFVGNPTGADTCDASQLSNAVGTARPLCPPTSQVGTTLVRFNGSPGFSSPFGPVPVFNMVPPPGVPARFGFNVLGSVVTLDAQVRSGGDYGITVAARGIPEALGMSGTTTTLWGVPSDPVHTPDRACPGQAAPSGGGPTCSSGAPLTAFLRNPTLCTDPGRGLLTTAFVDSWTNPGRLGADGRPDPTDPNWQTASFRSHLRPAYPLPPSGWGAEVGITGCDRVPFTPTLAGTPASTRAGSPSGFSFDLSLPQSDDPTVTAESDLRSAVVALPAGLSVSPSSADGLAACSPDQIGLHDAGAPSCPSASKIGTVTVTTPLLRDPLQGAVYLATPNDNPFGTLLSIYIAAAGPGVELKLAGRVDADPVTGQLTTTFDDNPQLPFSNLHLEFKGGPRAPLVMPAGCGTYTTQATLTGWNGSVVPADSTFTVSGDGNGGACPAPRFSPGFQAGTGDPVAGKTTTFSLQLTRGDADQQLQSLTVNMPSGLLGKIANAVLCSDADAANGTCPDGTKVGDVTVGAGAGTNPFYITNGRAYITGPYKGAPFGLSIVVPAVAGPFDLGNVVVRSALFVDKHDATLRVVSDPLPTILQGIPLDVRDVRVNIDKPGFIVNPTNCTKTAIGGSVQSTGGMTANVSTPFQVGECANLGFKPSMALAVGGKGHTHTGQSTPLSTRITMPAGDANLRFVRVTLPSTINARLTVIDDACTRAEFESDIAKCAHAQAGTAVAVTPLLRDPLRGKVYFVKNGHAIPDLFVALRGQVDFDLIGRITLPGGTKLATTFATAPDVPIRSFSLRLFGDSRHGSIGAAENLCTAKSRKATAALDFIGQNGRVLQLDRRLAIHGCGKPKKAAGRRR
ncbi:MAG TPA: hypothetical protein VFU94_13530 [Conexibacter sp.]|nr:hypothetical protein [Conexibacter sp.]